MQEKFNKYLEKVNRSALISFDEERSLVSRIKAGGSDGESAKEILLDVNLRFVLSIAKDYMDKGLSLEEIIEAGNDGLIKAAMDFPIERGIKFVSFSLSYIRKSIKRAINVSKL